MKHNPFRTLITFLLLSAGSVMAGTYVKDYNALGAGATGYLYKANGTAGGTAADNDGSYLGSISVNNPGLITASIQGGRVRLTQNTIGSTNAIYRLPDIDSGLAAGHFRLEFDFALVAGATPADGVSLSFGALPLTDMTGPGEEGYQLPGGMVISFDTYINTESGESARTLDVRIDGVQLVSHNESAFGNYKLDGTTVHVVVNMDASGLDVTFGSFTVCNNLAVPGLRTSGGDRFAFSARTGGAFEDVFLDNINLTTTPEAPISRPNLALSEMVIDNTSHEDEHCQTPGWVEIYNGTASAVSLNGWSLTDSAGTPAKWSFPAGQTIAAYGYKVVYFGHGEPPAMPDTRLHTNFFPLKTGGYLGLYQGATEIDSFTAYPPQAEDISYGHMGHPWTLGFIEVPSPGFKNTGLQEAGPPVDEEVAWPRDGGLITGPISLTLALPLNDLGEPVPVDGEIRYTLDNSAPTTASTLYTAPINISARTNVRARIFAQGQLPGSVTSRTFLKIDSSITNYRGTGQPFNSNLPVIVLDSFGRNLDAENSVTPGARPFRYTYAVVLDRDPANGNRTRVTPDAPVDFQGRGGTHVRGESSSTMPQRQYAWELWDNEENDKSAPVLGLPTESDWILYAPSTDKTLLRNFTAYSSMYDTNGESSAMRVKFVEVFFNQPPQGGISEDPSTDVTYRDYRGVYVLVERIKRGNDRVDISKLDPCDTSPSLITGGYIFKKDKVSADPDFSTTNQSLQIVEPAVTVGDAQWTWLRNHMNAFEAALYGANFADPVLGYRAYIDEQSFMDNQWWVEIFKQIDGYRLSTYFYKDRGQKIKSAPLWDYNLSMGNADYLAGWDYRGWYHNAGISQSGFNNDFQYYGRLRQDPGYIMRHWDRYWKLRKSTFATPNIIGRIDAAVAQVTDSQTASNMKNSSAWDITSYAAATNTPLRWPNSVPSVEAPAARHHARWQRLGIYDWPNALGRDQRDYYVSATDATDYATLSTTGYNVANPPAMSEAVHAKSYMKLRLDWIDDAYLNGNIIMRPPVFSQEGGNVTAPYNLVITPYSGTPPPGSNYGVAGSLLYLSGPIYYTTDGSDPAGGTGTTAPQVVRNFVTDNNPCHATVPASAVDNADSTGKDWKDPDFNYLSPAGVAWYAGSNGVGYDDNAAVDFNPHINIKWSTPTFPVSGMPTMRNVNTTTYVRLPFTLTAGDIAGIDVLRLSAKYDDGFIAYLNGVKIGEKNPPVAAPAYNSLASGLHDDPLAIVYENVPTINTAAALAALRVGTNVLAVHGMNQSLNSNDLIQRFKLDGEIAVTTQLTINSPVTVKARVFEPASGRWSPLTEGTFVVSTVPASAANLVVSEFMYNPPTPTAAEIAAGFNNDNMFEYLEVQNISGSTIDLSGVSVTNGFTFAWPTGDPNLRLLAPGERAVMVGHAGAFAMRYAPGPGVKVVGVFDGNISNGGEHLVLSAAGGAVIKDFTYDDVAPWPVEADGQGYSLVLNSPASNPDHNLVASWRSSFESGGSPGGAPGPLNATTDTDGDGMPDLIEYATGSLRRNGASQHWPSAGVQRLLVPPALSEMDYVVLEYRRSLSASGVSLEPEVSTALTGWAPLSTMFTLMGETDNADGTATVKWRSTQPASALARRLFLQLRAVITP